MTAPGDQETAKAARVRGVVVPTDVPDEAVWATQFGNSLTYAKPIWLWFTVELYPNEISRLFVVLHTSNDS